MFLIQENLTASYTVKILLRESLRPELFELLHGSTFSYNDKNYALVAESTEMTTEVDTEESTETTVTTNQTLDQSRELPPPAPVQSELYNVSQVPPKPQGRSRLSDFMLPSVVAVVLSILLVLGITLVVLYRHHVPNYPDLQSDTDSYLRVSPRDIEGELQETEDRVTNTSSDVGGGEQSGESLSSLCHSDYCSRCSQDLVQISVSQHF